MEDAKYGMVARTAASVPAMTIGHASDIANAVIFLVTKAFATSATVGGDGGGVIA